MEFDVVGLLEQMTEMAMKKAVISAVDNSGAPDKDIDVFKRTINVFEKHGIGMFDALDIIKELAEALSEPDKKTTDYVCNHCGKKFNKTYPGIESILAYHLETEHANEIESIVIEDNFKEE